MNALTRAGVITEDKLFATLDPTTRGLRLPNGDKVMVVDTVGFSHKIPHSLIEAFKSTLEEVTNADLLLHVVDMTSPIHEKQIQLVEAVLRDIGAGDIPYFMVPNKIDLLTNGAPQRVGTNGAYGICPISALTGTGMEDLLESVGKILDQGKERAEFFLSPSQVPLLSLLRQRGRILEEEYEDGSIHVTALLSPKLKGQMRKWLEENGHEALR
jgi:GTP-binding protein HflX